MVMVPQACRRRGLESTVSVRLLGSVWFASVSAAQLGYRYRHDVWKGGKGCAHGARSSRNASNWLDRYENVL
jgi:hypothetical protein